MKKLTAGLGAAFAVLAIAVPAGTAGDGNQGDAKQGDAKAKPAVVCAQAVFVGRIARVGVDGVLVRPGQSESGRPLAVRLTPDTVVRVGDTVADASALQAGKRARFLVRGCRSGDVKTVTARIITILKDTPAQAGDTRPGTTTQPSTEPKPEPKPTTEVCGKGEMDTELVAVSTGSITVRTSSSEGVKEWPVTVNGDTVVRKNDQNVALSSLQAGDKVHVVLLRCPVSGTVTALRIVVLQSV